MDEDGGRTFTSPAFELSASRQQQPALSWDTFSGERGMPGRSQQGQLLSVEDEPEETESEHDLRRSQQNLELKQRSYREQFLTARQDLHANSAHRLPQGLPAAPQRTDQTGQPPVKAPAREDESGTDTDEDGELIRAKAKAAQEKAAAKPAAKRRAPGKTRAGAGISLGLLIKEGIIWPGRDVLSVEYKSVMTYATLTEDGQIVCNINGADTTFESPSAFSIFLKRMVNPNRKADDGWKTVKFNGKFLETYKLELARRRLAAAGEDGDAVSDMQPAAKSAKLSAESTPGSSKPDAKPKAAKKAANGHAPRPASLAKPAIQLGSNLEDATQLMPCEHYRGEPGSSTSGSQPFRVIVSPGAALFMDFHAHLSDNEVVGLLGGHWFPEERLLRVERSFPVQEVQSERDTATVEMQPEDEARVRQAMAKQHGLRCVGWYHSHPQFACHPSNSDIMGQMAHQKQHRVQETGDEPFIGAIVGPYDRELPRAFAKIAYFLVEYPKDRELPADSDPIAEGCLPMNVEIEEEGNSATEVYVMSMPQNEMRLVAQRCASSSRRADIMGVWKGSTSRLEKLKTSIAARLPEHWPDKKVEEYLTKADAVVAAAWKIFGQTLMRNLKAEEEELEISDVTQDDPAVHPGSSALKDDASGGRPPQALFAAPLQHPSSSTPSHPQATYMDSYSPEGGHAREEFDEPAAHSYFDQGPAFGDSSFGDDGFLGGQAPYRGSPGGQFGDM